jgi:competence protein ComEC
MKWMQLKWVQYTVRRWVMALVICLAILAGILLARFVVLLDARWFLLLIPFALLSLRRQSLTALLLLAILGFGLGWWRGSVAAQQLAAYDPLYYKQVTLVGHATDDAVYGDRYQLVFTMDNIRVISPYPMHLTGSIQVKGFGEPAINRGNTVQVSGKLFPTLGNNVARVSFAQLQVVDDRSTPIDVLRRNFTAGMESALPEPAASFGMGLLIGQRSTLPPEIAQQILMVGLTHVIAVSGYNLTIIVQVVRRLLEKRSKFQATFLSCILIVVFLLITGLSPSIVRASVISVLTVAAWYFGRELRPLVLLLVSAAITVLWNPAYLWGNVSWYLSFLSFFGVLVLGPLLTRRLYKSKEPKLLMAIVLESVCASVLTMPYILYIFGQTSLVALPANVLVVPLIPLGMLLSVIAGLAGMLVPGLAGWFAWPATWLLTYMLDCAQLLSRVPHAFVDKVQFSAMQMTFCYVCIGLVCIVLWRATSARLEETPM